MSKDIFGDLCLLYSDENMKIDPCILLKHIAFFFLISRVGIKIYC